MVGIKGKSGRKKGSLNKKTIEKQKAEQPNQNQDKNSMTNSS